MLENEICSTNEKKNKKKNNRQIDNKKTMKTRISRIVPVISNLLKT